ncbi:hypothetical protein ABZX95_38465 [Streptomyces sp. NPDC004232]|uniref:hypothetical protein n=1 Tax=Streptomyces sp. NPDC004232 TaxID=3154454 RepID=UPI0033B5EF04
MRTPPPRLLFGLWLAVIAATGITVIGGLSPLFGVLAALLLTGAADPVTWGVAGGLAAIALVLGLDRLVLRRPRCTRAQHAQPGDVEL